MMSISPLRSAAGAAEYYLKEEKDLNQSNLSLEQDNNDNYYLKEKSAEPNSFWHGKLAKEAGLLGKPVEQAALESVLSGNLGEESIKGKREQSHRSGYDLTFSAPKGISILALVGGDTRLMDIHDNAVKFVLDHIEADTAQVTSINKDGEREFNNTSNMAFAVVRHKTSRENDPQIHSHALTANMTRDQESQLRALAATIKQRGGMINGTGNRIFNFQKYYSTLYQSYLAKQVQDLGYQVKGVGNGQFEVEGVPNALNDQFSTRKQQIDQQALNFGDTQAARDTAALDTRKAKSYESDAALNAKWQQQTKNAGFNPETLVQQAQQVAKSSHNPEHIAKDAFERAVEHLGQHSTVLHLEKVIELATSDFTKGGVQANAIDLKAVADQWIKEGALVPLAEKGQYTTQTMLDTEQHLMTVTQGRAHHMRTPVSRRTLNTLDIHQDQQQKVADIYQSTKQFHVVNVHGSNASIAQSLLNVGNHAGKRVHLVSQHTKDKQRHDQQVQRESRTFATWVKHHFTPEQRHTRFGLLQGDTPLTNKDILLIDDAQTLSADELIALTEKAQQSNSKVVMLNRVSSRQGFKANNAIELYRKGNVLSHSWVNQTTKDTQVSLHAQDTQALAKAYTYLTDKDDTQVIATSGVEQRRLTDAIRASMQNAGQLARTGVTLFTQQPHYLSKPQQSLAQHYKAGMTLRHWKDGKPHDVVVASTDRQDNLIHVLSKTDGSAMTFNPSSQDFKALNMQVFKPEALTIVQGERLISTGKHFPARLDANSRYTVTEIGKHGITLKDRQGEQQTLPLDAFKDAPLQYDYVQSANQLREAQRTLVSGKAFTLSKALFHDVTEKTERIDVFTDHPDKAQRALEKSDVKPSAIER
ncbi:conjugative transfer relaxase/helicase TraI, partial [Vibrio mediterranei]